MKINKSRRRFFQASGLFAAGLSLHAVAEEPPAEKVVVVPSRSEIPTADTWDLTKMFASDADWKKALESLREKLKEFRRFEGTLDSADTLLACLELDTEVDKLAENVGIYAHLRFTEDVADPKAQEMNGLADAFGSEARQATSFIRPELLAIDEKKWTKIVADPRLTLYKLKLERLVRQRPHTLAKGEEQILAQLSEVSQAASNAFGLLNNADLKFGTIKDETGRTVELSTGSFVVLMNSPDREIRKKAFHQFYGGYKEHVNTLSSLLASSIKKDTVYAKIRKHPSALESALFNEEIPRTVYDNLVGTVNAALPTLHRYYEIRRRKMGIDSIHMYDVYIPILSDIQTNHPWDDAVKTIGEALKPLGDDYVRTMTEGLTTRRWCDRYENKGKRSGAFSYGSFSAMPYILMNYKSNVIDSMFTLAHEAGHSMHSFYSAKTQPFIYYDYVTFVAEVASTFNEDMLARYLFKNAKDDRMKAWLINKQIDDIRQTLFRQTMFAEFEERTHAAVEAGASLTSESILKTYHDLLIAYFGPKFAIDDDLDLESLRVPHFYRAFYVYKYATGISASLALAKRVTEGGEKERNDYLTLLSGGSSKTPLELLRGAGVDMEQPSAIESAMQRFKELVDELDRLI